MNIFLHIFPIITVLGLTNLSDYVEYNHRKIDKEITRTFEISSYDLEELNPIRNYATNGEILGKYFNISQSEAILAYMYVGRVFTCPTGGCDENINSSQTTEYFDYVLLFDKKKSIKKVSVINYQATHGQEVCAKGWLRQFIGINSRSILKPGKNIDTISGATKSVSSIVKDVSLRLKEITAYQ